MVFDRGLKFVRSTIFIFFAASSFLYGGFGLDEWDDYVGWSPHKEPPSLSFSYEDNASLFMSYLKDYDDLNEYHEIVDFSKIGGEEEALSFQINSTGWHVASPGEVPYHAILYAMDAEGGDLKACNGAMLTRAKVLALCGCVDTWLKNKWRNDESKPFGRSGAEDVPEFDILSDMIYVTAGSVHFDPKDKTHYLSREIMEVSECLPTAHEIKAKLHNNEIRNVRYGVFEVEPAFSHLPIDYVIPWPPVELFYNSGQNEELKDGISPDFPLPLVAVSTISFEMHFKSKGYVLMTDYTAKEPIGGRAVIINHVMCNLSNCGGMVTGDNNHFVKCFYDNPNIKVKPDICGMVIGSPIIWHGRFVGLAGSPARDCDSGQGAFIGAPLSRSFRDQIALSLPAVTKAPYVPKLARNPSPWQDYEFIMPYQFAFAQGLAEKPGARSCAGRSATNLLGLLAIVIFSNINFPYFSNA